MNQNKNSNLLDLVVVTGAGRGIGRAIALEVGKKNKVLCISKTNNAEETKNQIISNGGSAEYLKLDLENYAFVKEILSTWIEKNNYKKIGLVLAAAILGPTVPFEKLSLESWDSCHKINILGNLAVVQSFLPTMKKNHFGKIIFFAGGGAAYANPTFPAYSATKTATVRITENLFEELKNKGNFSIACLSPGAIETDMLVEFKEAGGEIRSMVDISEPVNFVKEFLSSDTCSFSGCMVHVKNNWNEYLNSNKSLINENFWKLRRIE